MISARHQLHTEAKGITLEGNHRLSKECPLPQIFYREQDCPSNKVSKSCKFTDSQYWNSVWTLDFIV